MSIGENIKMYRNKKGLTQPELGELIHKSESSIRKYESGKVTPTIDILNVLANKLGVSLNDLMGNDKKEISNNFNKASTATTIDNEIKTINHIEEIIKIMDDIGYEYSLKFFNLLSTEEKLCLNVDVRKFVSKQLESYLYLNKKYKTLPKNEKTFFGLLDTETINLIKDNLNNTSENK